VNLKAMIVAVWRPQSCEFRDALGGRDHVNLEVVMKLVWTWTWRL
jgi:hypothetical protein